MSKFNLDDYCEPMFQEDSSTGSVSWLQKPSKPFLVSDCLHQHIQDSSNRHFEWATANMRHVRVCEEAPSWMGIVHVYKPILNTEVVN